MLLEELKWSRSANEFAKWAWEALPGVNIASSDAGYYIFDNNTHEEWFHLDAITAQAVLFCLAKKYGRVTE